MSQALVKLNTGDLTALTPHLALGPEAATATHGCTQITESLVWLEGAGYLTEATRQVAHTLPKRTAAAGAAALASVRGDVTRREERLRRFLESGRNIATGGPGRLPAEMA
jgi:hypothetical protein